MKGLRRWLNSTTPATIGKTEATAIAIDFLALTGNEDAEMSAKLTRDRQGILVWRFEWTLDGYRPYGGGFTIEVDAGYGFVSFYAVRRR